MTENLSSSAQQGSSIRVMPVEIVHPGVAFPWTEESMGLKVFTNLRPKDINNRTEKPVLFKTDEEVWGWAKRLRQR